MKHAHEHVQALQTPFLPILVLNEDDFSGKREMHFTLSDRKIDSGLVLYEKEQE